MACQPNKRLKSTIEPPPNQLIPIDDMADYSISCGICLSDYGKAIRGQIDCCSHYFCFVCIMEWAKVESRCPMCKRRFSTIRRPPKDGVFSSERIVNVPQRDQVYHPYGNTTVGPFDPYVHAQCSVCNSSADESLLLLCDLCDCPSHTSCVGLGATVPEGDWFCHDCAVSRTEHNDIEANDDGNSLNAYVRSEVRLATEPSVSMSSSVDIVQNPDNPVHWNSDEMAAAEVDVSIFDIVWDPDNPVYGRPRAVSSMPRRQPCLAEEITESAEITPQTGPGEKAPQRVADETTQVGARTLSRCRNVHGYIRALRENWNSLRSGSLSFSSSSAESSTRRHRKHNTAGASHDISGQPHSSFSTSVLQLPTHNGPPGVTGQDGCSQDIDKAWKMMEKAKSIQRATGRTKNVDLVSKCPSGRGGASKQSNHTISSLYLPKSQQLQTRDLGHNSTKKQYRNVSHEKEAEKHASVKLENKICRVVSKEIDESRGRPSTNYSLGLSGSLSSCKTQTSRQDDVCHENGAILEHKNLYGASLNTTTNKQHGSNKLELLASSSCRGDNTKEKVGLTKDCAEPEAMRDDAKSEIQSLVKLNLKLLSGDKQLGVHAFKEVARLATHTILAACGLGHSRYVIRSFPNSICSHSEQTQHLHKSTLMPNSCRECFFVFVKDVVNSILSENASYAKSR